MASCSDQEGANQSKLALNNCNISKDDNLQNSAHFSANMSNLSSQNMLIEFSPSYSVDRTIYVSFGTELFQSTDGGNTWKNHTIPLFNNPITLLYLLITRSPQRRFIAALIAALLSYLLLGYLGLEKRLPFRKWQIKSVSTFAVFIGVLIFLSN